MKNIYDFVFVFPLTGRTFAYVRSRTVPAVRAHVDSLTHVLPAHQSNLTIGGVRVRASVQGRGGQNAWGFNSKSCMG